MFLLDGIPSKYEVFGGVGVVFFTFFFRTLSCMHKDELHARSKATNTLWFWVGTEEIDPSVT